MNAKRSLESRIRGWFPADPAPIVGSQITKLTVPKKPPTIRERLVGGLGAAGGSFTMLGVIMSFVPAYPHQMAVLLVVLGVPLLAAAFLVWLSYRRGRGR